jgi:hypothetical protein
MVTVRIIGEQCRAAIRRNDAQLELIRGIVPAPEETSSRQLSGPGAEPRNIRRTIRLMLRFSTS